MMPYPLIAWSKMCASLMCQFSSVVSLAIPVFSSVENLWMPLIASMMASTIACIWLQGLSVLLTTSVYDDNMVLADSKECIFTINDYLTKGSA